MGAADYYERISSVPVYEEDSVAPRMQLKIKYRTGVGYKKTVEGFLLRHDINPLNPRDIKMVLLDFTGVRDNILRIPVSWIKSMERFVKVDPDFDIGI